MSDPSTHALRHLPPAPARSAAGPVRQALSRGFAHLRRQSRWNDGSLNAETAALSALRARFDHAWAIGYSMGGNGALRLARALRLDRALLVSPQVTLDPGLIPGETRYADPRRRLPPRRAPCRHLHRRGPAGGAGVTRTRLFPLDLPRLSPYTPPIEFEGWGFPAFPRF